MWKLLSAVTWVIMGLSSMAQAQNSTVTLQWDPNSETDLSGYRVYWGNASRSYGVPISIGLQTTYTVTGLKPGATYYFAVTAYNTAGLESGFSNEVFTTIPTTSVCDINMDGSVNVMDIQLLTNAILGIATITNGDINLDGRTDVLDLQLLTNVVLGITSCPIR